MIWLLLLVGLQGQPHTQPIDSCLTGTFQRDAYAAKLRLLPDGAFRLDISNRDGSDVYHDIYSGTYTIAGGTLALKPGNVGHSAENAEGYYEEAYLGAGFILKKGADGYRFEGDLELPAGLFTGSAFDLDCG
jgi:hypothetical protein